LRPCGDVPAIADIVHFMAPPVGPAINRDSSVTKARIA
jgi:hypothetical protein